MVTDTVTVPELRRERRCSVNRKEVELSAESMELARGIEPPTCGLQNRCSAIELRQPARNITHLRGRCQPTRRGVCPEGSSPKVPQEPVRLPPPPFPRRRRQRISPLLDKVTSASAQSCTRSAHMWFAEESSSAPTDRSTGRVGP